MLFLLLLLFLLNGGDGGGGNDDGVPVQVVLLFATFSLGFFSLLWRQCRLRRLSLLSIIYSSYYFL